MDGRSIGGLGNSIGQGSEEEMELRRGPWTVEEDLLLVNYIANHGEGRWNALARCAGLKRTGKSCRLRWLNYLRPDVRRGNITPEEQLLILELHSRWGNRWSKIAQYLPGRTDNEIKNYWRTRVQKQAKQLRCDVNSQQFKAAVRQFWMPRLLERIRAANLTPATASDAFTHPPNTSTPAKSSLVTGQPPVDFADVPHLGHAGYATTTDNSASSNTTSSESTGDVAPAVSKHEDYYDVMEHYELLENLQISGGKIDDQSLPNSAAGYCTYNPVELDYRPDETTVGLGGEDSYATDYTWNIDDIWQWQPQFCDGF